MPDATTPLPSHSDSAAVDPQSRSIHATPVDPARHVEHVPRLHLFDFKEGSEAHVQSYPAIEWIHGHPVLLFNAATYARINYSHLKESPGFESAEPDADYSIWAREVTQHAHYHGPPAPELAKAMWVAKEDAWLGAMPQELSFLNQQTFWSTIALVLTSLVLLVFAKRKSHQIKPANRVQHVIETLVLYVRDDIVRPNISHNPDAWTPFFASLFIALLACNLFGLVPLFATATGNFAINVSWAAFIFVLMVYMGIRENGPLKFWVRLIPMPWSWKPAGMFVYILLALLEWVSLLTRPLILALRLFGNMMAGHMVLMVFAGLGFIIVSFDHSRTGLGGAMTLIGGPLTVAFYFLELLMAFIQAYIFTLLAAVFIGACAYPEH